MTNLSKEERKETEFNTGGGSTNPQLDSQGRYKIKCPTEGCSNMMNQDSKTCVVCSRKVFKNGTHGMFQRGVK
jgi:hypothetical protein